MTRKVSRRWGLCSSDRSASSGQTDFTDDLKKFDGPTLLLHGEDEQVVPVNESFRKSARLIKGAKDVYFPGAPHGITATHQGQINEELLAFLRR